MAKIMLKPRRARPFWFGHPWVFSGATERIKGRVRDGDVVELCDHEGHEIGRGFFNSKSQIRVRVVALAHERGPIQEILESRLRRAMDLRLVKLDLPQRTSVFRLVHGEGDGLPGLVVDVVDRWLVIQVTCLGLVPLLDGLLQVLSERMQPRGIIERVPSGVSDEEGLERRPGLLSGILPEGALRVQEEGTIYFCDPVLGQKTGFFCDQRPNRVAVAALARGCEVLDAFSYVGGFGLRMARQGATSVHLVDSSAPALEMARLGAEANQVSERVTFEKANVLRALDHYKKDGRSFDLVVVDPPKLVRRHKDLRRGLRLFGEINAKALSVLRPGGLLVTCSCSQHILDQDFEEILGVAAKETDSRLQEVWRGGQGPDHPVLLPLTQSRYLKASAFRVWR